MVKVAYYCTASYTEVGAIDKFLNKINCSLKYERKFPVVSKPAPKIGRCYPEPQCQCLGATGSFLVEKMIERIRSYPPDAEVILLIDDADCKFSSKNDWILWCASVENSIREILNRDIKFVMLLASPEIEIWFVADRTNTFDKIYKDFCAVLNASINSLLQVAPDIEFFGMPQKAAGGCQIKLSEQIQSIIDSITPSLNPRGQRYSKRRHGVEMLAHANPQVVASHCRIFFRDGYNALVHL